MDIMRPVPFMNLIERILGEYKNSGSIFSIKKSNFYLDNSKSINILNQSCSVPLGPAAGPHSQLTQNVIASYLVGGRFMEVKTVQIMDTLEIAKPCIDARDEGYNVEWSTEFTLEKAFDEYLKAWVILHFLESILEKKVVKTPSFIFNMSVGYNLEGIKTPRMQKYINSMLNADVDGRFDIYVNELRNAINNGLLLNTDFEECKDLALETLDNISKVISPSVTLSTMHGCPPKEIEAICSYMLSEKHVDTFVKLNPTLLGYDEVRSIFDNLGYNYIGLNPASFEHDLQYKDAVSMLKRLHELAKKENRLFGVKLTNTLGCINDQGELPGDEMYMSGRTLLPLSTSVALLLAKEFDGYLNISYSGGANAYTVKDLFETGIHPITLATDLLKPGGYNRLKQMAKIIENSTGWGMNRIDIQKLEELNKKARDPKEYISKDFRGTNRVKLSSKLELTDCAVAPCVLSCPINQDVPLYVQLAGEGKYAEALEVIYDKNALPNITSWICDHQCQNHCTRLDYDGAVKIRELKKICLENGFEDYINNYWEELEEPLNVKAAVVGAGPAGLAAAYFLAQAGFEVEIYEREQNAGGVVANIIPSFRIPVSVVEKDVDFILKHGVKINYGVTDVSYDTLKSLGSDYIFYALGSEKETTLALSSGKAKMSAINYLKELKAGRKVEVGNNVIVVGGGNTAMDAARAAAKNGAITSVVYRRGLDQMPADKEEYLEALEDGVKFYFLSNPKSLSDGKLLLAKMVLGEKDESGRRRPVESDNTFTLDCSALITAIGEKPDNDLFTTLGINDHDDVYLIGDAKSGPSTVVRCIRSADEAVSACISSMIEAAGIDPTTLDCGCDDDDCHCHDHGDDCHCHDDDCHCHEHEHEHEHDCHCHEEDCHDHECGCADDDCHCHDEEEYEEVDFEAQLDIARNNVFVSKKAKSLEEFVKMEACKCLSCDIICSKCVDVCPNRANVSLDFTADGCFKNPYQILHLDAYCNECGNCETFCPHIGGPYKKKFTLFSLMKDFENSTNDGFLVEGENIYLRRGEEIITGTYDDCNINLDANTNEMLLINKVFTNYKYLLNAVGE